MINFRKSAWIGVLLAIVAVMVFGPIVDAAAGLAVTRGGTGTVQRFTPGSVVFAGPDGSYSQDNSNLNWNDSTNTLTAANVSGTTATLSGTVQGAKLTGTSLEQRGANGQAATIKQLTELTTIAAAATTATTIEIPANVIVLSVSVRVTVLIPTAATFTVTGTTSTTAFQTGASVAVAAGTTDVGTKSCPYLNSTAQTVTITPNASPAANTGRLRVTITYIEIAAAAS